MHDPQANEPRYIKSGIPDGRSGSWTIETFEIEPYAEGAASDMHEWAVSPPGRYKRLKKDHVVFMTDLYDEWHTQKIAMEQALRRGGHVLISGLGLGMVVESILQAPGCPVEHITVLELSADVKNLSGSYLENRYRDRLEIHLADVYTWQPPEGQHYSVIWHDIWPNPQDPACEADMVALADRYRDRCEWHGSWPREYRWIYEGLAWDREGGD